MSRNKNQTPKSCGPQHLVEGEPNSDWGLDELDNYAQKQHREIVNGETGLAPTYWRLGAALDLAKEKFQHGKWGKHLQSLGIDRTRASKARAIHRTFGKVDDLEELTVEEAYRLRDSKPAGTNGGATCSLTRFRKSLDRIAERTGGILEDAVPMAPRDAESLLPAVRGAIDKL